MSETTRVLDLGSEPQLLIDDRIYYGGMSTCHNVSASREGGIGVARLPKERLVARVAGDETGVLLTKPVTFTGDSLCINANAQRGLLRVELTDTIGTPIDGFAATDCAEIREDGFRIPVRWNGSRHLSELAGKPARLRFYMHQARLYAFQFGSAD